MMSTFLGFIYSLLTLLPVVFIFSINFRSLLIPITLILLTPVFRSYIKSNIYNFEDREGTIPTLLSSFFIILSLIISLGILGFNPFFLLLSIPIFLIILIFYMSCVYDILGDKFSDVVDKVLDSHITYTLNFSRIFIILKLITLVTLSIFNYSRIYTLLWLLGFVFDFAVLTYGRRKLYDQRLLVGGMAKVHSRVNYRRYVIVIFSISLIISSIFASNSAIIPYYDIINFLKSFSISTTNLDLIPVVEEEGQQGDLYSILNGLAGDSGSKIELPLLLRVIFKYLVRAIYIVCGVVLIYIFLYPIFSPLFKKNKKKINLRLYYLNLIKSILDFFKSLFIKNQKMDKYITRDVRKRVKQSQNIDEKKRLEINKLLKYYLKLLKKSGQWSSFKREKSTINEAFYRLSQVDSLDKTELETLRNYFNIGFFSNIHLGGDKLLEIKSLVNSIIKKLT